jgi:hypothetical protein
MKKILKKYYIVFFFLSSNFMLFAQPGTGNGTGDLEGTDAPAVPINDYIWLLALTGLIFVFLKLYSISKKLNPIQV